MLSYNIQVFPKPTSPRQHQRKPTPATPKEDKYSPTAFKRFSNTSTQYQRKPTSMQHQKMTREMSHGSQVFPKRTFATQHQRKPTYMQHQRG